MSDNCRDSFLNQVDRESLPALRLVCHNFGATASRFLFKDVSIAFKPGTFKPARMAALDRIGRHAKRLSFHVPHSADSFLPPLLHPVTGEQLTFTYQPQLQSTSKTKEPKYGTWEMTDLLIRQYPPLFHAATNIPSFIRAFAAMPSLEHITINCPDQNMSPRYRRSIADYALVSLRIAIERAPLLSLYSLALNSVHPAALLYLQPILSFGSSPNSCRRWSQIRELSIEMHSAPLLSPYADDHLRVLQAYLRLFSPSLTHLSFRWLGSGRGPSPLAQDVGPIPLPRPQGNTNEKSRPTSPRPLRFSKLQHMLLENATMDSEQVAQFIAHHRPSLVEFCFEDVSLRNGDWESTLEPLRRSNRRKLNKGRTRVRISTNALDYAVDDTMDVPCMLSPVPLSTEPIIEETLEPQDEANHYVGGVAKSHRVVRWFDRKTKSSKAAAGGKERAHHWRRMLHGHLPIFTSR